MLASGGIRTNEPQLNSVTVLCCFVASLGPLLYGMDIGIIGGVLSMPVFLQKFFPQVYATQQENKKTTGDSSYCSYSSESLSIFASCFLLAGMISSLIGSWLTSKHGRKASMSLGASCYVIGSIINFASVDTGMLFVGRIINGLGCGFTNQSVPVYLSELPPPASRGAVLSCFQIFINIGIVAGAVINYFTSRVDYGWRISLGVSILPALIFLIGCCFLPETPTFLYSTGNKEDARATLHKLRGENINVDHEMEKIERDAREAKRHGNQTQQLRTLMTRPYRGELSVAVSVPIFARLTGTNAIQLFAPQLFASIGGGDSVLPKVILVYSMFLTGSLAGLFIIDRVGRKPILLAGAVILFLVQASTALVLRHSFDPYNAVATSARASNALLALICICVITFGCSWSPIAWFLPVESQSQATRSGGACISVLSNFTFIFLTTQFFLPILCSIEWGTFLLFACFDLIMATFVWLFVVETKGIPIEDMRIEFQKHKYWKQFAGQTIVIDGSESREQSLLLGPDKLVL